MDLSADSAWSRQLAAIRSDVPNLRKSEIEATPGRIRRPLRPLLPDEIAPGSLLDAIDLSDAKMLVEFVCTCRGHVINEVTTRMWVELQQYLESTDEVLLDALRNAGDTQWWRCRPAVPAIADRSRGPLLQDGLWRGRCGALAKAAEIAMQTVAVECERKPVRT